MWKCFAIAHSFSFPHVEYLPSHYLGGDRGGGDDGVRNGGGLSTRKRRQQHDPYNIYSQRNYYPDNHENDGYDVMGGDDDPEDSYLPPTIRALHAPMGFKDALWSSTSLTHETFDEIKRFRNGVSDELMMNDELGMV